MAMLSNLHILTNALVFSDAAQHPNTPAMMMQMPHQIPVPGPCRPTQASFSSNTANVAN